MQNAINPYDLCLMMLLACTCCFGVHGTNLISIIQSSQLIGRREKVRTKMNEVTIHTVTGLKHDFQIDSK